MLKRFFSRLLFAAFAAAILWGLVTYPPEIFMPTVYETEQRPKLVSATPAVSALLPAETDEPQRGVEETASVMEAERGDILCLLYHDLTTDPTRVNAWMTTPENLQKNIRSLLELGYVPLSIEDYIDGNYSLVQDYFIVTFDDGYLSNLTLALPVLQSLGVKGTVFVITKSVTAANHMSWEQLRQAQDSGVLTLYSHTYTHMNAQSVLRDTFLDDARRAWSELSCYLGDNGYKILAYPYGMYTQETMRALCREGCDLFVIQDTPAWYDPETDGKILVRVNVSGTDVDMLSIVNFNRSRAGLTTIARETAENP